MQVRQSTARTIIVGPILDTDGAAKTDEVVASIKIHKNGAAAAALNASATLTHSQTGFYRLALTTSDLDTLGCAELSLDSTTNSMPIRALNVLTADAWDSLHHATSGKIRSDLTTIKTQTVTAASAVTVGAYVGGTGAAALASEVTSARMGALTDWINGGRLDLIIDAVKVKTDGLNFTGADVKATLDGEEVTPTAASKTGYTLAATTGLGNQTANITGNLTGSVGSVTGAVGSVTGAVGSVAGAVGSVTAGVTLANGAITNASLAGNMEIVFETDFLTNYNATRNAWATNVQDFVGTSASDPFNGTIVAASVTGAVGSVTGAVGSVTGNVGGSVASVTAGVTLGDVAHGGALATLTLSDYSDFQGSAGDPWATAIPGAYMAGTAGYILGTNLDAAITARTLAAASYFDVSIDSVTVGTNNDKSGYTLAPTTGLGNQTANITGNLSGSVGSVTGAVGSVTGAVGSVAGAVGSVTAGVTLANGAITNASLAGNMEIVFETDFLTNYNATRNAWATNVQDFVGTSAADPFGGTVVAASVTGAVGSVTGAVGSVTGNVGGNVTGSVASVTAGVTLGNVAHGGAAATITLSSYTDFQGSAGDPWATAVPGAYGAGTAGYILGTTVPAILDDTDLIDDGTSGLAKIATDVAAILVDTGTTIPGTITTLQGNVTSILEDTGTTIPASLTTIDNEIAVIDGIVDDIKAVTVKLDTTLVVDGLVYDFTSAALAAAPTGGSAPTVTQIRQEMDANSTQLALIVADTNELQTDWANNGRLDLILDARASQTSIDTVDGIVDAILIDTGTTLDGLIKDIPTNAEFALRTLPTADYVVVTDTIAGVTTVGSVTNGVTLTAGERTTLAAAIEAAIVNELDGTAVMQAIADLIASDMTTGDLSVQAIAAACRDAILNRVLAGNHDTLGTTGMLMQDTNAFTNELQLNQGNWLTATGFATPANVTDARDAVITQGNSAWVTATGFLTTLGTNAPIGWLNAASFAASALDGKGDWNVDKTGFKLASDGLDSISIIAPSGVASNFREMVVALWRRFYKKATKTDTTITTLADDGTTAITTQTISDDGTTETQGAAS